MHTVPHAVAADVSLPDVPVRRETLLEPPVIRARVSRERTSLFVILFRMTGGYRNSAANADDT